MAILLRLSRAIDWVNAQFAVLANWLVLLACLISAGNAAAAICSAKARTAGWRSSGTCSPAWCCSARPYTLKMNEHVRVDLLYGMVSERTRIWIDIIGGLLFLLPICMILIYFTWPWFVDSWQIDEGSSNAGGLLRWPVKLLLPVGFCPDGGAGRLRDHQARRGARARHRRRIQVRKAAAMSLDRATTWRP